MAGLFFTDEAPTNYRDWLKSDESLYVALAEKMLEHGVLAEPDSREPFFLCESHDDDCLKETLEAFEISRDFVLKDRENS